MPNINRISPNFLRNLAHTGGNGTKAYLVDDDTLKAESNRLKRLSEIKIEAPKFGMSPKEKLARLKARESWLVEKDLDAIETLLKIKENPMSLTKDLKKALELSLYYVNRQVNKFKKLGIENVESKRVEALLEGLNRKVKLSAEEAFEKHSLARKKDLKKVLHPNWAKGRIHDFRLKACAASPARAEEIEWLDSSITTEDEINDKSCRIPLRESVAWFDLKSVRGLAKLAEGVYFFGNFRERKPHRIGLLIDTKGNKIPALYSCGKLKKIGDIQASASFMKNLFVDLSRFMKQMARDEQIEDELYRKEKELEKENQEKTRRFFTNIVHEELKKIVIKHGAIYDSVKYRGSGFATSRTNNGDLFFGIVNCKGIPNGAGLVFKGTKILAKQFDMGEESERPVPHELETNLRKRWEVIRHDFLL